MEMLSTNVRRVYRERAVGCDIHTAFDADLLALISGLGAAGRMHRQCVAVAESAGPRRDSLLRDRHIACSKSDMSVYMERLDISQSNSYFR